MPSIVFSTDETHLPQGFHTFREGSVAYCTPHASRKEHFMTYAMLYSP